MNLVIDANVLFAALIKNRKTRELILSGKLFLYTPKYFLDEFTKHLDELAKKTKVDRENLIRIMKALLSEARINMVSITELKPFIDGARKVSPDPNDYLYFALALKLNCAIWSNDKKLKEQKRVKVLNTEEVIELFK